ncbi:hypothetical protein ACXR2U_12730 [Jatrophihabitans sp. YIM 134969]
MARETTDGEFRVPEDVEAEEARRAALLTDDTDAATDEDEQSRPSRRWRRERHAEPVDLGSVDLTTTPGPVVGAVALGVVAAPLLGVYAVLFVSRYFLEPGVSPDITSSWTGEGIAGVVAAVLAIVMLVIVARAAGGRGLPVFVGAQVVVVGTCAYLLSDDAHGGRSVTIAVLVLSVVAIGLALTPVSRRWFAAHTLDRASS